MSKEYHEFIEKYAKDVSKKIDNKDSKAGIATLVGSGIGAGTGIGAGSLLSKKKYSKESKALKQNIEDLSKVNKNLIKKMVAKDTAKSVAKPIILKGVASRIKSELPKSIFNDFATSSAKSIPMNILQSAELAAREKINLKNEILDNKELLNKLVAKGRKIKGLGALIGGIAAGGIAGGAALAASKRKQKKAFDDIEYIEKIAAKKSKIIKEVVETSGDPVYIRRGIARTYPYTTKFIKRLKTAPRIAIPISAALGGFNAAIAAKSYSALPTSGKAYKKLSREGKLKGKNFEEKLDTLLLELRKPKNKEALKRDARRATVAGGVYGATKGAIKAKKVTDEIVDSITRVTDEAFSGIPKKIKKTRKYDVYDRDIKFDKRRFEND